MENPLEQIIIDRIRKEGAISFEAFMEMALYCPGKGYYASHDAAIGREGDFYTSPHLHPVFGAMIGKTLIEMWSFMGRPPEFCAIEAGAGAGYLCRDMFDYLNRRSQDDPSAEVKDAFLSALHYVIVEPYDHFREKQKELLYNLSKSPSLPPDGKCDSKVRWVSSLKELHNVPGCVLSNELLDAFPVHLVEMNDELNEIHVAFDGTGLVEEKKKTASDDIHRYVKQFSLDLPQGYRTEINLRIRDWLGEASAALSRGFVLTIDYGYTAREYYCEERTKGTLLCYHRHMFNENPFQNIGEQDITAHVNFSSLHTWGEEVGLKTAGYCSQGIYFISSGIDEVITELYSESPDYLGEVSKIKGLILPQGMGESHSVIIQYKGEGLPELRGFSMRNQLDAL